MVGEIVFHLGDCKTGTTSIQRTFAAGAVRPGAGAPTIFYPPGINHIPLASALHRKKEMHLADARFARLRQQLDASRADIAVISAEAFEFTDPKALAAKIDLHLAPWKGRIRLISYVRPHAERLVSAFAERTKQGGHDGTMDDLFDKLQVSRLIHYTARFARWQAVFGSAHTIRPMVRNRLKDGDVVRDLVDFVLNGAPFEITQDIAANESLTTADLAALRLIHAELKEKTAPRARDVRHAFGWNLATILSDLPKPATAEKPMLHRSLADRMAEAYAEDAASLDRLYFDGTPMADALAAAPGKARPDVQPTGPEVYFDASGLRMLQGIAALLARMLDYDPEYMHKSMRSGDGRQSRADAATKSSRTGQGGRGQKGRKGRPGGPRTGAKTGARIGPGARPRKGKKPAGQQTARKAATPTSATPFGRRIAWRIAHRLPLGMRSRLRPLARRLLGN